MRINEPQSNLVGLVTFDDLVVDGSLNLDTLRPIVTAQLEVKAPQKPAGLLHPHASFGTAGRARALARAQGRVEAVHNRLVTAVAGRDWTGSRPLEARIIARVMHALLAPDSARGSASYRTAFLEVAAPARSMSRRAGSDGDLRGDPDELARALGLDPEGAKMTLQGICKAVSGTVTTGQINDVRGQLPEEMKHLFPPSES